MSIIPGGRSLAGAEVVVVGAGVIGSAIGYRLAQAGAKTTLIDPATPGSAATSNSFCWLNGFNKFPESYYRLSIGAVREHKELQDEFPGKWLFLPGALHWEEDGAAGFTENLEHTIRRMRSWGARVDSLSRREILENVEPGLSLDSSVDHVYRVFGEGWVYPALMIGALLQRAQAQHGLTHVRDEVTGFLGSAGDVTGVRLNSGRVVAADVVVLAAGTQVGRLAGFAGVDIPLATSPGTLLVTAPVPVELRHAVIGPDAYIRPDGGGRLRLSSDALLARQVTGSAEGDPDVRALMSSLVARLPHARGAVVERVLHGDRPLPPDGYPVLGFDPKVNGLYHAWTHSGITLAPMIARVVVDHLNGMEDPTWQMYSADRLYRSALSTGPAAE